MKRNAARKSAGNPLGDSIKKVGTFRLSGRLCVGAEVVASDKLEEGVFLRTPKEICALEHPAGDWAASLISRSDGTESLVLKPADERRAIREARWRTVAMINMKGDWVLSLGTYPRTRALFPLRTRCYLEVLDGALESLQIRQVGPKVEVQQAMECRQVVGIRLLWHRRRSRSSHTKPES